MLLGKKTQDVWILIQIIFPSAPTHKSHRTSSPNSLAHCRQTNIQTTLNVVATGCVEAALPFFIANQILLPTLTPWRVGEAEEEVRGWS